jgi:hypothetical protein
MYDPGNDDVPRSVTPADFLVVATGFLHNIASSIHAFTEDLMELATYNAIRQNKVNAVWEQFTNDLEKMED